MIIKCADVNTVTTSFGHFTRWGSRLFNEIHKSNTSLTPKQFMGHQDGFLSKYALPLFSKLVKAGLLPDSHTKAIISNKEQWESTPLEDRMNYLRHAK